MTKSQRASIIRIIRYYRERNSYTGCTSVRVVAEDCGSFISLSVETRRSDCEKYSQRQIVCNQSAHIFIGQRGGVDVKRATLGLGSHEEKHVQFMTRATR